MSSAIQSNANTEDEHMTPTLKIKCAVDSDYDYEENMFYIDKKSEFVLLLTLIQVI